MRKLYFSFLFTGILLTFSCQENILSYLANKDSKEAKLEDARIHLDNGEYDDAIEILDKLKSDTDTDGNDVRLMLAAAGLGKSQLDIWSIISNILDADSLQQGDNILDALSEELLGTGEEKERKLLALDDAIENLKSAPDPNATKVSNTLCFLSGVQIVPIVTDATTQMANLQNALTEASQGNCQGATQIPASLEAITTTALRFSDAFATADNCPFLDINTDSLGGINGVLQKLISAADKGCSDVPPAVEAFFPQCVKSAVGIPNVLAKAGDNVLSSCELALHCLDPSTCF